MHATLQALLGLQQIDRKLYKVESELRRLPEELSRREADLAKLAARRDELRARVAVLRAESKEIEDYTTGMRQRQRKLENESNKPKVDAALLASFEHEIRSLKRNISQAEDDALRKMGNADEVDTEIAELEVRMEKEQEIFTEFRANVEKELAEAETKRAELATQREAASADGVPPEALNLYKRLLETREGEALAELADGHCQTCFVQIPRNLGVRLARGETVQCPTCTRILYTTF
jgi:uncharacterized protein